MVGLLLGGTWWGRGDGTNNTTGVRRTVGKDADPLNLAVAEYTFLEPLLSLGGPRPLGFQLYYGSARNTRRFPDGLPFKFSHDQHSYLVHSPAANEIALERGPAIETGFGKVNGEWVVGGGERSRLQLIESGAFYYVCDPLRESIEIYRRFRTNAAGTAISAVLEISMDRSGNRWLYTHGNPAVHGPDEVSDELGRSLRFDYRFPGKRDTNAYLASVTDQGGRVWRFLYEEDAPDAPGAVVLRALVQPDGGTNRFRYFTNGHHFLHALTLPGGNTPSRQFYRTNGSADLFQGKVIRQVDALGNGWDVGIDFLEPFEHPVSRISLKQPDGTMRSYVHDHGGTMLRRFTDEEARSVGYELDPVRDQVTAVVDRRGGVHRIEYHAASGKIAALVDARGLRHRFHYEERRMQVSNPINLDVFTCTFFDLTRVDYPDGTFEELAYDDRGRVIRRRNAAGDIEHYGYNGHGQVTSITNAVGGVARREYDAHGNLVGISDSDGVTRRFGYDALFRRTSVTNADGTTVRYEFDAMDRMTALVDERGTRLEMRYDPNGNLLRVVRAAGTAVEQSDAMAYDAMDRMVRRVDAAGAVTGFEHTFRGGMKRATYADGVEVSVGYDRRHFVTQLVDEAGHRVVVERDAEGLPVRATSPQGRVLGAAYDAEGYPLEVKDPKSRIVRLAWDHRQRLTNVVDRLGRGLVIERDGEGRILKLQLPVVGAASYGRNGLGRITRLTDFRGIEWRLDYTPMGRLREVRDPLDRAWRLVHDNRGRLSRITHPDGVVETLVYDPASRLLRRDFSDGLSLGFEHDALHRLTGTASVPVEFEYDSRDNLTRQTAQQRTFRAGYDNRRRMVTLDYDGLTQVSYAYDARGLLRRVEDGRTGAFVELEHDADRLLVRVRRSNGVTSDVERDANGQVTRIRHGGRAELRYTRNAGDEITRMLTEGLPDLGSLLPDGSAAFTYDPASQLNAAGFENDVRGRRIRDSRRAYRWDSADRLVAVTNGAAVLTQDFRATGEVATETIDGVVTTFHYHDAIGGHPVLAERRGGEYRRYYVFTPAGRLLFAVELPANAPRFHHFDHAGSTVLLTDEKGAVTDTYGYTPYGRLVRHEGRSGQRYTYNGEFGVRVLAETGLYAMGARFYDSLTGRFLTRDPAWVTLLERPTEMNPYGFARQNPVSFADPTGRESFHIGADGTRLADPHRTAKPGDLVGEVDASGQVKWKVAVKDPSAPEGVDRVVFEDVSGGGPFRCVHLSTKPQGDSRSRAPGSTTEPAALFSPGADLTGDTMGVMSPRLQSMMTFDAGGPPPPRVTRGRSDFEDFDDIGLPHYSKREVLCDPSEACAGSLWGAGGKPLPDALRRMMPLLLLAAVWLGVRRWQGRAALGGKRE